MSKLTKKPSGPAILRVAKTALVAGSLVMVACGDDDVVVGISAADVGPEDALQPDSPDQPDSPPIGVPAMEDVGLNAMDAGSDAPNIGVPPAEDGGA